MPFRRFANDIGFWRALFLIWAGASTAQTLDSTLLGDVGGVRPALAKYGISVGVQTINDSPPDRRNYRDGTDPSRPSWH
jgi:hypothetical protein